jgi:hypothetical protein
VADRRRATKRIPNTNSLVAAAQVMTAPNMAIKRATIVHPQGWHHDAWGYYDIIGELRFGMSWISNAMSRVNLAVARPPIGAGDEPALISPDDEDISPSQRRALEIIATIADGPAGQGQLLGSFGLHLSLAGIAWLVVEPPLDDPIADQFAEWRVLATDEIREQQGEIEIRVSEREWRPLHPNALVVKVWRRHPRHSWLPDAPTRAVLPVLREIDLLQKHVLASAQSRLAGAGLLAIPSEAVFPPGQGPQSSQQYDPDDENNTAPEDNFVDTLIDAMTVPINDRSSAAAVVPLVVRVPGDLVDKMKHISFATPFDDRVLELMNNAIKRLALGLDIPPEILTGTGSMNHWGAWQVAEEALTLHIEPLSETVVHALTIGFLKPALAAEGYDTEDVMVWYDTSDLRTRPDLSKSAVEAYDRNELSSAALLRELGLNADDMPDEAEKRERVLLSVVRGAPTLAPAMLAELGYLSLDAVAEGVDATQGVAPDSPSTGRSATEPTPAPSGTAGTPDTKPDALTAACDQIVRRALERAGSRLRSAAGKGQPGGAASITCTDPTALHTVLDATAHTDLATLLDGAWHLVPEVAARYGAQADDLALTLDTYTRALLAARQEHHYGRLALALGTA